MFLSQQSTAYELRWDVRTLRDGIQPIYDPSLTTPDNSDLKPHEMVLAVEINGDARAYPIEPLVSYEIVNDVWAGCQWRSPGARFATRALSMSGCGKGRP